MVDDQTRHLLRSGNCSDNSYSDSENDGRSKSAELFASRRWTSVRVMYLTMFVSSMGFSIILSSVWPYLRKVDKNATPTILGIVVAMYSLGQLLGSPVLGWWANRRSSKEPLVVSCFLVLVGSCMYAYSDSLSAHDISNAYFMMAARFLIGFGAGNTAVARSYISHVTSVEERTSVMANMSISQALGFIIGPALALAFVPLGDSGVSVKAVDLELNIYTAPGFLGAILAVLNIVFFLLLFHERRVNVLDSGASTSLLTIQASDSSTSRDRVAVVGCIGLFFVVFFVFTVFETLTTPLSMDEYGWTSVKATLYNGILFLVAAVISVAVFMAVKPLSRRIDERKLLVVGFVIVFCGFVILMPWSSRSPLVRAAFIDPVIHPTHQTTPSTKMPTFRPFYNDSSSTNRGCPLNYPWCVNASQVLIEQFLAGAAVISIGFPICSLITYSLYSKVLGDRPQGTMMGWLTAAGSLARTLGPLFVSTMYDRFGPRWTFVSSSSFVVLAVIALLILYRRLVPLQVKSFLVD